MQLIATKRIQLLIIRQRFSIFSLNIRIQINFFDATPGPLLLKVIDVLAAAVGPLCPIHTRMRILKLRHFKGDVCL